MKNNGKKIDIKVLIIIVLCIVVISLICCVIILLKNRESNNNYIESQLDNAITHNTESLDNVENVTNNVNESTVNKIGSTDSNKTISFNELVSVNEKYELIIKSFNIKKIIEPPNTTGYYHYYEASDGHQYLDIVFDYKNLTTSDVRADKTSSIKIKYDEKYDYSGFSIIEDEENDFTYSNIRNIAPLSTGKIHYLIEIPDEVANNSGSIVATITCGSEKYDLKIR